jgi:hypothetical protein
MASGFHSSQRCDRHRQGNSMAEQQTSSEEFKYAAALIVAIGGMVIAAILIVILAFRGWAASEVSAVAGVFTTLVGSIVGAFLGVQVAATGKEKAEELAQKALAALPPEKAKEVIKER